MLGRILLGSNYEYRESTSLFEMFTIIMLILTMIIYKYVITIEEPELPS